MIQLSRAGLEEFVRANLGAQLGDDHCYEFVRQAFATAGENLSPDYFTALSRFDPLDLEDLARAWDVVVIKTSGGLHCGLLLSPQSFVHSIEDGGVSVSRLSSWSSRITGFIRLRGSEVVA